MYERPPYNVSVTLTGEDHFPYFVARKLSYRMKVRLSPSWWRNMALCGFLGGYWRSKCGPVCLHRVAVDVCGAVVIRATTLARWPSSRATKRSARFRSDCTTLQVRNGSRKGGATLLNCYERCLSSMRFSFQKWLIWDGCLLLYFATFGTIESRAAGRRFPDGEGPSKSEAACVFEAGEFILQHACNL